MAHLRIVKGPNTGHAHELKVGRTVIGRKSSACDIVLDDFAVSREHLRIDFAEGRYYVVDLDSYNGTIVGGKKILPEHGRRALYDRELIEVACFVMIFEEDPSADSGNWQTDDSDKNVISSMKVGSTSSITNNPLVKLRAVLNVIEDLANSIELDVVLPKVLESMFRILPKCQSAFIMLRSSEEEPFKLASSMRADGKDSVVRVSKTIIDRTARTRMALLLKDALTDSTFRGSESVAGLRLRSLMCAPLIDQHGEVIGILQLEAVDGHERFTDDDLSVLSGIARHLAIVIENSMLHDSTLRRQRIELEERFRKLVEGSVQGILIHSDQKPMFVNEAWARFHGYTAAEVLDKDSIAPMIHPDERAKLMKYTHAWLSGGTAPTRYEYRGLRKDGSAVWFENMVSVIEWEGEQAVQSTIYDITEQKRAHDDLERRVDERTLELAESEALYHSLVDAIPLCVARKDLDGRFTFVNRELCEMLGKTSDDILGLTDYELFPADKAEKYRADDRRVADSGETMEIFETFQSADGEEKHVHVLKTPIQDQDGVVGEIQFIFWDVTQQKKASQEINRYAEELERSNADLSQFASIASHDLQAPLRTVTSYCELLKRRYQNQLDEEFDEFSGYIVEGTRRMQRLIEDLLQFSRVTTKARPLAPTPADEIVETAMNNLFVTIKESHAEVTFDSLPTITVDPSQMVQVFQNLIDNAIKCRSEDDPRIEISCSRQQDEWRFAVRDNGVGIDPTQQERIFVIFQRLEADLERPGTGMGLAICKRIIERHGGRIWVESQPGEGSSFLFTIPINATVLPEA